ncbi:aminoglycoside phosphotransferase family protein [Streptomyces sparsogenes]|uniref:aminoglycoside phosphotransferase family protein n=1 Tax=Streptomyces sparsogenes TaxID=67365 RepID=UPI0033C3C6A1
MNWLELYMAARDAPDATAGYYNRNAGVATADGKVNVRIPLAAADTMDVRLWREEDVLAAVRPYVDYAPELRYASQSPRFQVQSFIEGRLLDGFAPRGSVVPGHVIGDVVTVMNQLAAIPQAKTPPLPRDWPLSGDSAGFGRRLAELTQRIHADHLAEYGEVFGAFGMPADPLGPVGEQWENLTPRPFAVLHADLHRKNMIVSAGAVWFLDWELALWGDPAYEMAIHVHKMDYPEPQRDALLRLWSRTLPQESTQGWQPDVQLYLRHERIKSAVVDTIRYSKQLAAADATPAFRDFLVARLANKLNAALRVWGKSPDMTPQRVRLGLRAWLPHPGR